MYLEHFSLNSFPFENVPNPDFFMEEGQYGSILTKLRNVVELKRGLCILAGPIGSGKTTLGQKLVSGLSPKTKLIWLAEPPSRAKDLYMFIARSLGLPADMPRIFLLQNIRTQLMSLQQDGRTCLLMVDESHHMNDNAMEAIRILTNLEVASAKLLQIILLGQPELMDKLYSDRMEPLRQRAAVLNSLQRLRLPDAKAYIRHRLRMAGASGDLFTDRAMDQAAFTSGGIPRLINSICHTALQTAFEAGRAMVEAEDVQAASYDFGLGGRSMEYYLWKKESLRSKTPGNESDAARMNGDAKAQADGSGVQDPVSPPPTAKEQATPEDVAGATISVPRPDSAWKRPRFSTLLLIFSVLVFLASLINHIWTLGGLYLTLP